MHFTTISLQLSISGITAPLKRVSFKAFDVWIPSQVFLPWRDHSNVHLHLGGIDHGDLRVELESFLRKDPTYLS